MRGLGWDLGRKLTAPLDTRITSLEDTYVRACWFEEIASGTSGTLTLPTGGGVVLNQWEGGVDALASKISSSWPSFESPVNAGGTVITATLDTSGNWGLSDTPSSYPVAIIYVYRVKLVSFSDAYSMFEAELETNIQTLTEKTTPVDADLILIADSAAANARKKVQIGNLPGSGAGLVESTLTNKAGTNTVIGYVYRLDPDNAESFDYASEDEDRQVCVTQTAGVADGNTTSVILGGICEVYLDGVTNVDISINIKFLYFSTTNGQVRVSVERKDGCFGEALEDSSGAGLITCIIYPRERIRKWAMMDEQSWESVYILPIHLSESIQKYSGNPIIPEAGTGFEQYGTLTPRVIIDHEIKVYYAGQGNGDWPNDLYQGIGLATAPFVNPIGNYTKHGSNPLITPSGWESAAGKGIFSPSVVYEPNAPNTGTDYKYKMWYTGAIANAASGIQFLYSANGIVWTKYDTVNPVIPHAFGNTLHNSCAIDIAKIGKVYFLCYRNAANGISLCHSKNGITWINDGVILTAVAGTTKDVLGFPALYHTQGNIYLTYSAVDGTAGADAGHVKTRMALASLKSFLSAPTTAFVDFSYNEILYKGNPGTLAWEENNYRASFLQLNDYFLFCFDAEYWDGNVTFTDRQCCLAYIKTRNPD